MQPKNHPPVGKKSASKKKRVRIKPRLFVFAAILVGLLIWGAVALATRPAKEWTVTLGKIDQTIDTQALIIRDEKIYPDDSYGKLVYTAKENSDVQAGDSIMQVYAAGYIEKTVEDLEVVRQKIADYQKQLLSDIVDETLQQYDQNISEVTAKIRSFVSGGDKAVLLDLEQDLQTLLDARREYLKTSTANSGDTTLASLYEEETRYINRNAAWMTEYTAESAGRVSFYFDGLEPYLTLDSLADLTCENVRSFLKGTIPEGFTATRGLQYLYRLVNPSSWYTAFIVNTADWKYQTGETCTITFSGYEDIPFLGTVYRIAEEEDQTLVVLSMQEDIDALLCQRSVKAAVGSELEGYVVPNSALKMKDGTKGIYLADSTFVAVRVLGKNQEQSLVLPLDETMLAKGTVIKGR